ncbi:MAG: Superoxide dismutase [Candidatus Parcubacteria bacterium]|jgi:Fe-Mn family superoxide dismutase
MKHQLPKLTYEYNALEPHIDAKTMEIHYTKHHQAYIDKLNALLDKHTQLQNKPLEKLMTDIDTLGLAENDKLVLRNHGGGHLNHTFFWSIMGPTKKVDEDLVSRITKTFGSLDTFKEEFSNAAINRFGSGWAWLVEDETQTLKVYSTPNQDSPYLQGHTPLIGLDVWEHAYYLTYQNRRAEYVKSWWNVLTLI